MGKKDDKNGIIKTFTFDASKSIRVLYRNENEFNKLVKSLKMYNMLAYKDFIFNIMPKLRAGNLIGENINENIYECKLSSSNIFEFVYGKTSLIYEVISDHNIELVSLEPSDFLTVGHQSQLYTYKGVPISCPKDRFKVDLYLMMNKE